MTKLTCLLFGLLAGLLPAGVLHAQVQLDLGQPAGEPASVQAVLSTKSLQPGQEGLIAVELDIKKGYHAQSHHKPTSYATEIRMTAPGPVKPGDAVYPVGHLQDYPGLGKINVYTGKVVLYVPFKVSDDARPGETKIAGEIEYQVCDDAGQCLLPETKPFAITAPIVAKGAPVEANQPELFKDYEALKKATPWTQPAGGAPGQVQAPPANLSTPRGANWGAAYALVIAFAAGLLFNVMPCVLPVLPLKAIGFYEVAQHNRGRSVALGAVFALGVVLFFFILSVPIFILKQLTWGEQFSNPYVVWFIVVLLVIFAAGMFGAFTVNLPTGVYAFTPRHDTYSGNILFGLFTALLATPCTAPMLPPLMAWASLQPAVIAVSAMVMVGVGMAAPYFILSAFPNLARKMPRTGPWSELVKHMMGFLLLMAAAYFGGGQLIKGTGFWWVVVAVTAVACIYLVGRTIQFSKSAGGLAVATILAVAIFGGVSFQAAKANGLLSAAAGAGGGKASWIDYDPVKFEQARRENKLVLVKFTANWCATCQMVESAVFGDPETWQRLNEAGVVTFKADMTHSNPEARKLLVQLNPAGGIPVTALYSPKWKEPLVLESLYTKPSLLEGLKAAK